MDRDTLRVLLVPAFTPRRWKRFRERSGEASLLRGASPRGLARVLGLGRAEAASLARALARADPERELAEAAEAGLHAIAGPAALTDLDDPPPGLFVRGELLECDARAVAIVGSRKATPYGLRVAHTLAGDLARAGVTIVSGLARGIDAAAHEGALEAGGRTLAVLGSGLLNVYPPEHESLCARVTAALSEFPLRAPPRRQNFPRRNRIVAALSLGVVVVEAASRSGALGTAGHALDLGRVVMAVPGPVDAETSRGTLRMLQEGATPVGCAQDVFAALGWCDPPRSELPDDERAVLEALSDTCASAAEVAAATGIPEDVAGGLLVTLEIRGMVAREGGRFQPV